jgi:hypothetical protein
VLSPRLRRRLGWLGLAVAVVGGATLAIVLLPGTDAPDRSPTRSGAPTIVDQGPSKSELIPITLKLKRTVLKTAVLFVESAVGRQAPERAWPIVDAKLRNGMTLTEWKTGNIPVVPYPVASVGRFKIDQATREDILAEIVLFPTPGSRLLAKTFLIELHKRHLPKGDVWAVSNWVPYGISSAQMQSDQSAANVSAPPPRSHNLSIAWLLVPVGLIGLAILAPFAVFATEWRRGRRAARRHMRWQQEHAAGGDDSAFANSPRR